MCGRFSFVVKKDKVQQVFPDVKIKGELIQRYNIAPTQRAYVIKDTKGGDLTMMQWGLIPHWSKDGKNGAMLINARMETIAEKPSFRVPIQSHRCLVLADSFYEWRTEGGRKKPYRIFLTDNELMVFAGIWDRWYELDTFSIITTEPNAEMSALHDRMPVILDTEKKAGKDFSDCDIWLSKDTDMTSILQLCQKPHDGFLNMYKVNEKVNSVKNESPDLHSKAPDDLFLF